LAWTRCHGGGDMRNRAAGVIDVVALEIMHRACVHRAHRSMQQGKGMASAHIGRQRIQVTTVSKLLRTMAKHARRMWTQTIPGAILEF